MTKDEKVKKNIGLAFDLLREIIKNPELSDDIPNGSSIIFLDNDQPIQENENTKK